ncbi:MAG: hypothetical protein IKH05_09625 [Bacteroidaceae bacterium]|nr:hypothetical protein [Bacteroidaceae bacterium]
MDRKLTINDFIYAYFTYYCNGKIQSSLYQSPGMMGEMNEIKEDYNNISGTWSNGTIITIEMVLRKCVRGVSSRGHQYCISSSAIGKAVNNLLSGTFIKNGNVLPFVKGNTISEDFENFEELYDAVNNLINNPGIGKVTIYDTARRIGHILDTPIYPQKYVYLPAKKVKNAASFIVGKEVENIEPLSLFYPHFGTLPPTFIEDILCVFSHWFWKYAKCPNELPNSLYSKGEKRIGLPWWSVDVKTFREILLDEIHKETCSPHPRWTEFPIIIYPPSSVIKKSKKRFKPCDGCLYKNNI